MRACSLGSEQPLVLGMEVQPSPFLTCVVSLFVAGITEGALMLVEHLDPGKRAQS